MPEHFVDVGMEQTILNVLAITAVAWSVLPSGRLSRSETVPHLHGQARVEEHAMMAEAPRIGAEGQRAMHEARPC